MALKIRCFSAWKLSKRHPACHGWKQNGWKPGSARPFRWGSSSCGNGSLKILFLGWLNHIKFLFWMIHLYIWYLHDALQQKAKSPAPRAPNLKTHTRETTEERILLAKRYWPTYKPQTLSVESLWKSDCRFSLSNINLGPNFRSLASWEWYLRYDRDAQEDLLKGGGLYQFFLFLFKKPFHILLPQIRMLATHKKEVTELVTVNRDRTDDSPTASRYPPLFWHTHKGLGKWHFSWL